MNSFGVDMQFHSIQMQSLQPLHNHNTLNAALEQQNDVLIWKRSGTVLFVFQESKTQQIFNTPSKGDAYLRRLPRVWLSGLDLPLPVTESQGWTARHSPPLREHPRRDETTAGQQSQQDQTRQICQLTTASLSMCDIQDKATLMAHLSAGSFPVFLSCFFPDTRMQATATAKHLD